MKASGRFTADGFWSDYPRLQWVNVEHHQRFTAYVRRHGLPCQECGGAGGWTDRICELGGPWEPCGFCEGTGCVTRWTRGQWLRWKRQEKAS